MGDSQSNLSSAKYGYDFVVATTQASINATMMEYLNTVGEPEAVICYVADSQGNPTPIDYQQLKTNAKGSDPFAVPPNADPTKNADLQNLFEARFMLGFKGSIGLPPGYAPADIPDIVVLSGDASSVSYNLMCSKFVVVELTPGGGYNPPSWMNISQPPGAAWLFNAKVDMRLTAYDGTDYSKLPPAVQAQIKNLGGNAFSIQQLLFDLDNAALQSFPTMSGVAPGTNLHTALQNDFLGKYFSTVKASGQPILGASVTQSVASPSALTLTDLNFEVSPLLGTNNQPIVNPTPDQQAVFTLNYLCAVNGKTLPGAAQFDWNWMDESDAANFDGVLAINRNTFVNYLNSALIGDCARNCFAPSANVALDGGETKYTSSLSPGQTPTVTMPPSGATVLQYDYSSSASDVAGLNGDLGQLKVSTSYSGTVSLSGNQIVITQHVVIYLRVQVLATSTDGNIVDKTLVDTYTMGVNESGALVLSLAATTTDRSTTPSVNAFVNFFTNINDLASKWATWAQQVTGSTLTDIPVSFAQNFVFPGGTTFVFKDANFSDYQDLVAHITYADPSATSLAARRVA